MGNEYKKIIKDKRDEAKKLMTDDQVIKCNVAIHTASVAAATEAFIPLPGVDAIPITATQITMVFALGKVFNQKISDSAAKGIVGAAASTFVGRSLVKLIPVAGWVVSSAVAAGVTEAIGWTIAVDFAKQYINSKDGVYDDSENGEDSAENGNSEDFSENDNTETMNEDINSDYASKGNDENNEAENDTEDTAEDKEVSSDDVDDESMSNDFSKLFEED